MVIVPEFQKLLCKLANDKRDSFAGSWGLAASQARQSDSAA